MITVSICEVEHDYDGEIIDSIVHDSCRYGFRELVELLRDKFTEPSCSPGVPNWCSTEPDTDYRTGGFEVESIHPARDAKNQKRWSKAWQAAQG